jgi:hypothetical protein
MNQKLGILVNSLDFVDHVIELARAANAKGKGVRIHLSMQGIFMMQDKSFDELSRIAGITVCRESVESMDLPDNIRKNTSDLMVESSELSQVLADCSRCVAL